MTNFRGLWTLSLLSLLLCTWSSAAQTWQNERYHLSMQTPTDWALMSKALLAQTNANVSHVTGRGFIAGYALNETDTLVFPYMLVQFKPHTTLPEQYRPQAKLDERGKLELIYGLVGAFRKHGPLPDTIDTPQFNDRFGNDTARLTRLEDDGRFDFTGKIPHEVGQLPIRYHTHGVIGKEGVAMVSVFTVEGFTGLTYVIQNDLRTLTFDQGFTADALPDEPPAPVASVGPTGSTTTPTQAQTPATEESAVETEVALAALDTEQSNDAAPQEAPHPADATALIIILVVLGVLLVVATMIAWFISHRKVQAQRERRRARMERLRANQSAAQIPQQPRPAHPPTAQSRGSNGRQRHGTTRS